MTGNTQTKIHLSILVLYFLSGLVSLAYEILWVRMLSLEFGVSIFGVVVTVSVFMLGLGMGSLVGMRISGSLRNPLFVFALLEFSVALFSLVIPDIFQWLLGLLPHQDSGSLYSWYFWQFVFTGLVLMIPALMMGVGFPLILNICRELKSSLAIIYASNTLGAAMGAVVPLMLLPIFGWNESLYIVAGVGIFVAAVAGILSARMKTTEFRGVYEIPSISKEQYFPLIAYAGIGGSALMLEIGWTRLMGMLFLRTEYVLGIILAVFLLGTAAGSFLFPYISRRNWFTKLPLVAAGSIVLGLWLLPGLVSAVNTQEMTSFSAVLFTQAAIIIVITLPVTIILGAWLPWLNLKLGYSGAGGARLYGANSIGAALGAIIAGFVLIPFIGTYALIALAAIFLVLFSTAWVDAKRSVIYFILIVLFSIPVMKMVPVSELMPHRYSNTRDLYFNEDALNITHVIEKEDGQRLLLADLQRMDAASDSDSVHSQRNQVRLPLLLHPNPKSVLFLGLGTGISSSASMGYKNLDRTAVELSSGAIEAADKWFDQVNGHVVASMKIVRDDARRYLKTNNALYDVIVGDLFHPDLVGRSALLSRQQFLRVRNRLNEQGIFIQWIALNQFDKHSLNIVLRTFKEVFPDAVLFLDAFRLALVGVNGKLAGLTAMYHKLEQLDADDRNLVTGGESFYTWLGRYWGHITVDMDGDIQDEWNPKIEFRLPQARYNGELDLAILLNEMLHHRPHVTQALQELSIDDTNREQFERAFIATELAQRSWLALLQRKNSEGQRLLKLAYQANPDDRWIGMAVADASLENYDLTHPDNVSEEQVLQAVLKIRPDHTNALKRLWVFYKSQGYDVKAL